MPPALLLLVLSLSDAAAPPVPAAQGTAAAPAASATGQDDEEVNPDRPDLTNNTHIVPIGLLQIEAGGQFARVTSTARSFGSPVGVRIGLLDWLEARVEADGIVGERDRGTSATGIGNVRLGAKLRLWGEPDGSPSLAIQPAVTLPVASVAKGLGSGDADFTALVIASQNLSSDSHIDVNYGIGAIGGGPGVPHFAQHFLSASASHAMSERLIPYLEAWWLSKQVPGTPHVAALDAGVIFMISKRLALDGGVLAGLTGPAQRFSVFGGLSMIVGDVLGSHGVHARQRSAARRRAVRGASTVP